MTNIMNYVLNNLNQLPSYCYAEESLVADSRVRTSSAEELNEAPLISPGLSFTRRDNNCQQPLKSPPPGFSSLNEHSTYSSNVRMNDYYAYLDFGSASNAPKASFNDMMDCSPQSATNTTPLAGNFSYENTWKMYLQLWKENIELQNNLFEMFRELLKHSPQNKRAHDIHYALQQQLNRIYKTFVNELSRPNDICFASNASGLSPKNNAKDVGAANIPFTNNSSTMDTIYASSSSPMRNPFTDHFSSNYNTTFTPHDFTYVTNAHNTTQPAFCVNTSWDQIKEFNSHGRSRSVPTMPMSSMFNNYQRENIIGNSYPQADQINRRVIPTPNFSCDASNGATSVYVQQNRKDPMIRKETNPFKLLLSAAEIQVLEQNEYFNFSASTPVSYSCDRNLYNHTPNMESATDYNFYGRYENSVRSELNDNSEAMTHKAGISGGNGGNYVTKIVYEAGPVMYNTQQTETEITNMAQESNYNSHNDSNRSDAQKESLRSEQCSGKGQESFPQLANCVDASQLKLDNENSYDILSEFTKIYPLNDDSYRSQSMMNKASYQQLDINTSETWTNMKLRDNVIPHNFPAKNPGCSSTVNNPSPHKQLIGDDDRESAARDPNKINANQLVNNDEPMTTACMNSSLMKDQTLNDQNKSKNTSPASCSALTKPFLFRGIDSVKGVTIIFHIEDEGWILIHEFAQAFINITYPHLSTALQTLHTMPTLRKVHRSDFPIQFMQLDTYPLDIDRDIDNCITVLNLISLPNALGFLCKIKLISREEVENAFKKNEFSDGSIMLNVCTLICAYKLFRQQVA